jgi:hypothetical protein
MLIPLAERFWRHVLITDGCWLWLGHRRPPPGPYGTIRGDGRGKPLYAHRVAWELHYGAIPDGKHVLHHCDTPPCVRPDHLFLGTQADNDRDMTAKGRNIFQTNSALVQAGMRRYMVKVKEEGLRRGELPTPSYSLTKFLKLGGDIASVNPSCE